MDGLFRESKTVFVFLSFFCNFRLFFVQISAVSQYNGLHYNRAANESLMRLEDVWCFFLGFSAPNKADAFFGWVVHK